MVTLTAQIPVKTLCSDLICLCGQMTFYHFIIQVYTVHPRPKRCGHSFNKQVWLFQPIGISFPIKAF